MTGEPLDPTPAAPGTDTGGTAPPPAPPAPATHEQGADDGDFDLLDADGGEGDADDEGADGGDAPASGEEPDTERPAWQRPPDLSGPDADADAIAQWKETLGLPTDADGYEINLDLREGERITETGQELIDGLKGFALEHDLPPPAVNSLVKWYDAQIKAQNAKLAEADKALRKATRDVLTEKWAGTYDHRMEVAKAGARLLPQGLREALRTARTPDGRCVSDTPEFAEALLAIGRLTQKGKSVPTSDEERLAAIAKVRDTNIDEYRAKGLDKEYLALARKRDAVAVRTVTLSAAEEAEERELLQHMSEDIGAYQHRQWRGSGMTGSDRLLELRRKRAGEVS